MTKHTTRLIFALVILILVLSACGIARANIIGQWSQTDSASGSTMYFDFKQDGKLRISYDLDFQFVDDSTIVVKGSQGQGDTTMVWKIEGDKLTLTAADGTPAEFIRVK